MEISPVFNDSYGLILEDLNDCGYQGHEIPRGVHTLPDPLGYTIADQWSIGDPAEYLDDLHQADVLFTRRP